MRIQITTPTWHGTRTGTAREAFGRGRYHVTLDGETTTRPERTEYAIATDTFFYTPKPRELLFTASELEFIR